MKFRKTLVLSLLATAITMPVAFAQSKSVGTNCDTPGVQKGSAAWKTCYINSSIKMCSANPPQTYLHARPNCGCNSSCLTAAMTKSYGLRSTVCGYESAQGYLPDGVSVASCESDWGCYIGEGSCS